MKRFLLSASAAFLCFCASLAETSTQNADPVLIGTVLVNETNLDDMSKYCEFYNLQSSNSENGVLKFLDPNGNEMTLSMQEGSTISSPRPLIEIKSSNSFNKILKELEMCGYHKVDASEIDDLPKGAIVYEKGSAYHERRARCIIHKAKPNKITFLKVFAD